MDRKKLTKKKLRNKEREEMTDIDGLFSKWHWRWACVSFQLEQHVPLYSPLLTANSEKELPPLPEMFSTSTSHPHPMKVSINCVCTTDRVVTKVMNDPL